MYNVRKEIEENDSPKVHLRLETSSDITSNKKYLVAGYDDENARVVHKRYGTSGRFRRRPMVKMSTQTTVRDPAERVTERATVARTTVVI